MIIDDAPLPIMLMREYEGTHFVRAGTDPSLILLAATKRAIKFVRPRDYPRC